MAVGSTIDKAPDGQMQFDPSSHTRQITDHRRETVPQWGHMESVDPADAVTTIASVASCTDSTFKPAGIRSEVETGLAWR
ncbi:hypothetical protein DXM26_23385 [Agrobacterium tumefaciens]|nr:hypothetical protein DXM26_23385 [Agrobacterium tumefaciens]